MDQIKIGKFISQKRKEKSITQSELAEMLGITDRAISKWENGKCIPDAATIPYLCEILNITINDLFSGEIVDMNNKDKKSEENMVEITKALQSANKKLLLLELYILIISMLSFSIFVYCADTFAEGTFKIVLAILAVIILGSAVVIAISIEHKVGYHECRHCHHRYVPTFAQSTLSMHMGWTKYFKCPKCNKRSWHKKVLNK